MTAPRLSEAQRPLMAKIDSILDMARDLQARGLHAEAIEFAMVAAQLVQVARNLEEGRRALKEPQNGQ